MLVSARKSEFCRICSIRSDILVDHGGYAKGAVKPFQSVQMLRTDTCAKDRNVDHLRSAISCARSASSMTVKQWVCVIAVSVRLRMSSARRAK